MTHVNLWSQPEHARGYLARADSIPRRTEGETALLEWVPATARRVLDLGSGDGRLLARVLDLLPDASGVALDFSSEMLERLRARFGDAATSATSATSAAGARTSGRVAIIAHDLDQPLPDLGAFDAVVSSFAIHHVTDPRKRALYAEIFAALAPGGMFCNLEHVASATDALHLAFLETLDVAPEDDDPSNKLCAVDTQLGWLRDMGFEDVDCHWKWRELAVLAGRRPLAPDGATVAG